MATKTAARALAATILELALRPHNSSRTKQMSEAARQLREEVRGLRGGSFELQPLRLTLIGDEPKNK